ncbi:MAG: M57 family metalloprotease [Acidobacteriota bacterium]|nr:M57 family metalloprotease [Acidobacteriota bacterium]
MKLVRHFLFTLILFMATGSFATTFIVPDDAELVQKSEAIVTGVVVSASARVAENGYVETFYEIALDRVLKGPLKEQARVRVQSPGGLAEGRYTVVESAAHFQIGDEVLLFLTAYRGGWTTTDMTLGKFRFAVTSGGYSVAVRDAEDIAGWDRDGKRHQEKIRRDAEFIQFIEETVAGRTPAARDYEVEAGDLLAPSQVPSRMRPITELFPAPATTYSISFYSCTVGTGALTRMPGRWTTTTMNAGVPFYKNSVQNASGLGDGGVSIIQNGLAAWTNDCGSVVNIPYGGTSPNLLASDGFNVIIFNDPGDDGNSATRGDDDIAGSWTGSGIIARTYLSGGANHSFDGFDFVTITGADIVFQDDYAGTQTTIEEAMTHEIGHGIGFRHADKHYLQACTAPSNCSSLTCPQPETACDSNVQDCAATAIMTASVSLGINFTLQTWDINAADALYPSACVVVSPPTNVVATATTTSNVNVSWTASVGAVTYNVYRSTDGINYSLAGSPAHPTVTFNDGGRSANTAHLYKVRAVNGGESGDSNIDLATTTIFTDDPLVAGTTQVKNTHISELRIAVNAVRTLASLGGGSYTDPTLTAGVTPVKALHINDLRTAINAARTILSLSALSYGETVTASTTTIKTSHLNELRNGLK